MAIRIMVGRDSILRKQGGNAQWQPLSDSQATYLASGTHWSKWGKSWREKLADVRQRNVMMISYEGRVVRTGEMNGYDDSDFYAVVQMDDGSFGRIEYGTTRSWTYMNSAVVDASPEVVAAYKAAEQRAYEARVAWAAEEEAKVAREGREVEVIEPVRKHKSNRRIEAGERGVVFRRVVDGFKSSRWATVYRVGVELADGTRRYMDEDKVRVVREAVSA